METRHAKQAGIGLLPVAALVLFAGCVLAPAADDAADGVQLGTVDEALLPAPSKADIDAYARQNGFPSSDYPYYEGTNGCGNPGLMFPDSYRVDKVVWPFLSPLPMCYAHGSQTTSISFLGGCNAHDRCYVTLGADRLACDNALLQNLLAACDSAIKTTPLLPCPPIVAPPPIISDLLALGFIKGDPGSLARCAKLASYYYDGVRLGGAGYFGPSQQKAKDYDALVKNFIKFRQYGVCTGEVPCPRAASTVHRTTLTCTGALVSAEQAIAASGDYKCNNRYQQDCVTDGVPDTYRMEWCDFGGSRCATLATKQYACDPGATPTGTGCRATKLHRTTFSCNGTKQGDELVMDLVATGYSNYTCTNRFKAQCVDDGTWDLYYSEWCEYSCQ